MRKRFASLLVVLTAACDTAYSVTASDAGTDAQSAQAGDAGALVDGTASPVDGSKTDGGGNSASDGASQDAASLPFPVALGTRLRLWLDATDGSTVIRSVAGTDLVTSWNDKSDNHFVAASVPGGTVTYVGDTDAGGAHGIALTNGGYLTIPDSPALEFQKESFSIYVAARFAAADETNLFDTLVGKSNQGSTGYELGFQSPGNKICAAYGNALNTCAPAVEGFGIFTLTAVAATGGAGKGQLSAAQLGQSTTSTQADALSDTAPLQIGRGSGGAYFFTGTIFEIIVVAQPTATETTMIASYLEGKYGHP